MLKNVVGSPRVECSSPESQSATWACTAFLSSHQQLIPLKVRKTLFIFNDDRWDLNVKMLQTAQDIERH